MLSRLPSPEPLPPDAILLHIGVHKTGTTALQAALADARGPLKAHGVLYPGRRTAHHGAASAVLNRSTGWAGRGSVTPYPGVFERLARQARRHRGRVVLSSEAFCEADDAAAARVVATLDEQRTHVLVALRNLCGLLYSSWAQYLKMGRTRSYDSWLRAILDPDYDGSVTPSFWRRNEHGIVIKRWVDLLGPDRVTVLVLDDVAPSALFIAVAELLDIPSALLTSRMDLSANRALTAAEAELVRRLNREIRDRVDWPGYAALVRNGIIAAITEGRTPAPDEPRLPTPGWALDAAAERGRAQADMIRATGATILGDLESLALRGRPGPEVTRADLDTVPTDAVVAVLASYVAQASASVRRRDPLDPLRAVRNTVVRRKVSR